MDTASYIQGGATFRRPGLRFANRIQSRGVPEKGLAGGKPPEKPPRPHVESLRGDPRLCRLCSEEMEVYLRYSYSVIEGMNELQNIAMRRKFEDFACYCTRLPY